MWGAVIFASIFLISGLKSQSTSCVGRCGINDGVSPCQCNVLCETYLDCCADYFTVCYSCQGRCGEAYSATKPCQCNSDCPTYGNCCVDMDSVCATITDLELEALSEELLTLDVNNVGSLVTVDIQSLTTSAATDDPSPNPLFSSVDPSALTGPTISTMWTMFDNYDPDVNVNEDNTAAEQAEQSAFLDAVMATAVMQRAELFMQDKGLITGSVRPILEEIWFGLYSRGGLGSSGFEHVQMGETRSSGVTGFHGWSYFYDQENAGGAANYQGYMVYLDFGNLGGAIEMRFEWLGYSKPIGSIFIGTSPEFELAMYTVCFYARPNALCPISMAGVLLKLQTYQQSYNGNVYVGSAYPDLSA